MASSRPSDSPPSDQQVLVQAVHGVLGPLATLAVAKGLPYSAVEEALRRSFVDAAAQALQAQGLAPHRMVSRIAAATGINRREVTRLTQQAPDEPVPSGASLASVVFTRWVSDKAWRWRGKPRVLPRQGEVSFETLARSVTQDVHPRTILDELVRLQLADWDEAADTISLIEAAYTPHGDLQDMLKFLGRNVGDHLQAAVENVLSPASQHFEQAVFADGLPAAAAEDLRALARRHWQALLAESVPLLESHLKQVADGAAQADSPDEAPTHRVRLGLFTFHDPGLAPDVPAPVRQGGVAKRRTSERS